MVIVSPSLYLTIADAHHLGAGVDRKGARARYAGPPHAARDHGGMAGHPAACRQDALGRVHAVNVFWRCFDAAEDHRLAHFGALFSGIAVEHRRTGRSAGAGRASPLVSTSRLASGSSVG